MQDLKKLNELIDKASAVAGSDYRLGKMLHTTPQAVSDWRAGRRACPPADVALLAQVAGLDAADWLIRAVIEKHAGTPKGEALFSALGKGLRATGDLALYGVAGALVISSEAWWREIPQCIKRLSNKAPIGALILA